MPANVSSNTKLEKLGNLIGRGDLTAADELFVQVCYRRSYNCRDMGRLTGDAMEHIEELYALHFVSAGD